VLDQYLRSKYPNMDLARLMQINSDLKNVEVILSQIDNYCRSYSHEMWRRTFPKTTRGSIKEIPLALDIAMVKKTIATPMVRHPGELFNRIHMAAQLFRMKTPETDGFAWQILSEAFVMLPEVIRQQHPQLPRYLFMQFWEHTFDTYPAIRDVREQLFRYMNHHAELYFGPLHPITLITRLLPSVQHPRQVCELAWRRNLDTFDSAIGRGHDENLRSKMAMTGSYIDAERYDDCERVLREVMSNFEADSIAYYMRAAMCRLAWIYTLQDRYEEAEPLFEDVLQRCRTWAENQVDKNVLDDIFLAATTHLARIQARRSYWEGEKRLQDVLQLCTQTMGADHAYTYTIETELEDLRKVALTDCLLDDLAVGALQA
jgi:Tetratricopeptide repeat